MKVRCWLFGHKFAIGDSPHGPDDRVPCSRGCGAMLFNPEYTEQWETSGEYIWDFANSAREAWEKNDETRKLDWELSRMDPDFAKEIGIVFRKPVGPPLLSSREGSFSRDG